VVPPVIRIEELAQAGVADSEVGHDARGGMGALPALPDAEAAHVHGLAGAHVDGGDLRRRRRFAPQRAQERIQRARRTLDVNLDPVLAVGHPAGQGVRACQSQHERPEAHALDGSGDAHRAGRGHARLHSSDSRRT
jgi:hypothetical protein